MALRYVLSLVITVAALASPGAARRTVCECVMSPVACESIWYTDAAFVGRVLSITPIPNNNLRTIRLIATEVFKGVEEGEVTVLTGQGDIDCGFRFTEGETYLVFAHPYQTPELRTGSCSRTRLVADAAEDLAYLRSNFKAASRQGRISGFATRYSFDETTGRSDYKPGPPAAGLRLSLQGPTRQWTTTTGSSGTYEFRVPPGLYRLFAHPRQGLTTHIDEGLSVKLVDGRGCVVRDVYLIDDGRISGTLVDFRDRPIPWLGLELITEPKKDGTRASVNHWATTDAQGAFEFRKLEAGWHTFGVALDTSGRSDPDSLVWLTEGRGVRLSREQRRSVGTIRLPEPFRTVVLTGEVVDADGRVLAGAHVRHWNGHHGGTAGRTDTNGQIRFSVLAGRTYELSATWSSGVGETAIYRHGTSDRFEAAAALNPIRVTVR